MKTIRSFAKMKRQSEKIVMLTAYDFPSGKFAEQAEIDVILVGDSLGMVVLGYDNTLNVTMEDIIHHCKATRRGAKDTFIVADMPYMSYHLDLNTTKKNAARLLLEGKANAVKLEGGSQSRLDAIEALTDIEIPVVAHLGLTPQSLHKMGGYRVQGKTQKSFDRILQQAKDVENAGAFMLVLEGVPEQLAKEISEAIKIPTIGIGAGRFTDGQVMVYHDILGMSGYMPKFAKQYGVLPIAEALETYKKEVKEQRFPSEEFIYYPIVENNK
jgi:3-methyl-2-oxobutanoate hydroxymethyltransferase